MRKKVRLIFLCGIMLLSVCGCGNNFESEIVGNNFVRKIEGNDTAYGKIITSHTLIFEEDNKGISKVDIDFTDDFKEYAEEHISYDTRHSTTDFTYNIDIENNYVNFSLDDDTYKLKYDKESKCLIDEENEKIKYCK